MNTYLNKCQKKRQTQDTRWQNTLNAGAYARTCARIDGRTHVTPDIRTHVPERASAHIPEHVPAFTLHLQVPAQNVLGGLGLWYINDVKTYAKLDAGEN